jgi:hypothetical protein
MRLRSSAAISSVGWGGLFIAHVWLPLLVNGYPSIVEVKLLIVGVEHQRVGSYSEYSSTRHLILQMTRSGSHCISPRKSRYFRCVAWRTCPLKLYLLLNSIPYFHIL